MDISNFFDWFLVQLVRLFSFFFSLLGNITFYNTSLLELIINLLVIGVILDILVVSVRSRAVRDVSRDRSNSSKGEKNDDK